MTDYETIRRVLPWYRRWLNGVLRWVTEWDWRKIGWQAMAMVIGSAIIYLLLWGGLEGWRYVGR